MLLQKLIEKQIESYQSELMQKYCDEVENMYTQMRGWRHDYHNHIQTLQASMALGKYEEVNEYLRQLNDDLTSVDTVLKTGRVMVDALLNGKISLAVRNQIPVNAKAKLPEALQMNDVELCVLIGNLMDNAIEANNRLEAEMRFLRIYIGRKNTYLYIAVTNAAGPKQNKSGSLFPSSKGPRHGFGLARVKRIVQKHDGIFTAASEDGGFTAEILIPI